MTRSITLDTETTGFDPATDRIVEVGAVELVDSLPTGRTFHRYVNPGRPVPPDATAVHGLTDAFLADKPVFAAIAADLLAFLSDSTLVIHNAAFDVGFLNSHLPAPLRNPIVDSLALARAKHPGSPASLDALCRRYGVNTGRRTKHGALLDAELLAEVYGRLIASQGAFDLAAPASTTMVAVALVAARIRPLAVRLTEADLAAHAAMVAGIPNTVWLR